MTDLDAAPSRLRALRIPPLDLEDFLLDESDNRVQEFKQRKQEDTNKKQRKGDDYKVEHLQMFSDLSLEWPPKYSQPFEDAMGFLNYSPRMMELAWLCRNVAEMKGGKSEYARDLNMSIQWGDDSRGEAPCIICTSVIFLARRMRLLSGIEAMFLQMWPMRGPHAQHLARYTQSQLMDLAGNASNGAAVVAKFITIIMSHDWTSSMFEGPGALDGDALVGEGDVEEVEAGDDVEFFEGMRLVEDARISQEAEGDSDFD